MGHFWVRLQQARSVWAIPQSPSERTKIREALLVAIERDSFSRLPAARLRRTEDCRLRNGGICRHISVMLGQSTLVWQLQRSPLAPLDCVAGELADGRVLVRVMQEGRELHAAAFDDSAQAMDWAETIRQDFLRAGWAPAI